MGNFVFMLFIFIFIYILEGLVFMTAVLQLNHSSFVHPDPICNWLPSVPHVEDTTTASFHKVLPEHLKL